MEARRKASHALLERGEPIEHEREARERCAGRCDSPLASTFVSAPTKISGRA